MTMTPYSGREIPLIPDALYGIRGFNVNSDGTIKPLHRGAETSYTSGVHTARCNYSGEWNLWVSGNKVSTVILPESSLIDMHPGEQAPVLSCTCGFYAYFGNSNDTSFLVGGTTHVNGIVRATGRCIVGTLGFRAEKMEIVGLVCDYSAPDGSTWKQRLSNLMRDVVIGLAKIPGRLFIAFLAVYWAITIASLFFENEIFSVVYNALTLLVWSFVIVQTIASLYAGFMITRDDESLKNAFLPGKPNRALSAKIKKQYPDVEFFSTLDQAKAHFKVSKANDLPS